MCVKHTWCIPNPALQQIEEDIAMYGYFAPYFCSEEQF